MEKVDAQFTRSALFGIMTAIIVRLKKIFGGGVDRES
jgi:hypothetical protein